MNLWLRMLRATDTQALFDCSIMPWIKNKVQESFSKQDEKYYNLTTSTCILWESIIGLCCVRLPAVQQNIRYAAAERCVSHDNRNSETGVKSHHGKTERF